MRMCGKFDPTTTIFSCFYCVFLHSIELLWDLNLDSDCVILCNMQRVCGCIWAVDYLAQMMVIAINETMHTPPTKEPAISESCCPNSDLYSSANMHRHTE